MTYRFIFVRGPTMSETQPTFFHCVLRANPLSVRRTLTGMRCSLGARISEDMAGRLELVLAEVLNNVVEHGADAASRPGRTGEGPPRAIRLMVRSVPHGLVCAITDNGVLLPDECLAPRSLPSRERGLPEGGFGWYLIQDLVTDLSYSRKEGRNYLAFTILRQGEGSAAA